MKQVTFYRFLYALGHDTGLMFLRFDNSTKEQKFELKVNEYIMLSTMMSHGVVYYDGQCFYSQKKTPLLSNTDTAADTTEE